MMITRNAMNYAIVASVLLVCMSLFSADQNKIEQKKEKEKSVYPTTILHAFLLPELIDIIHGYCIPDCGKEIKVNGHINSLQLHSDGRQLMINRQKQVTMYDLATDEKQVDIPYPEGFSGATLSPDGAAWLAAAGHERLVRGIVRVYNRERKTSETLPLDLEWGDSIRSAEFSPSGKYICVCWRGCSDHRFFDNYSIFETFSNKRLGSRKMIPGNELTICTFNADESGVAFVNNFLPNSKRISLCTLALQQKRTLQLPLDKPIARLCFSRDNRQLLTVSGGAIQAWDAQFGSLLYQYGSGSPWVDAAQFGHKDAWVMEQGDDKKFRFINSTTREMLHESSKPIVSAIMSCDGNIVVTRNEDDWRDTAHVLINPITYLALQECMKGAHFLA